MGNNLANELEQFLGDPFKDTTPFSFKQVMCDDEQEAFPQDACNLLEQWGWHHFYVPTTYGGQLSRFDQVMPLFRSIARRDLTVAIGHAKTYLGAVSVWVGGSDAQCQQLATDILAGAPVSLGLTEREHGSDLLQNEVVATPTAVGYTLSGEKWLINNATRGRFMTVYARTEPTTTPRAHSLFLIDKQTLPPETYTPHPKIKTLGIRGADISGLQFKEAPIKEEALIGKRGHGLEIVLKGFQLTRPLCANLSLGAADTGLRLSTRYATQRHIYDGTLWDIPHARRILTNAFIDLLMCDAYLTATMRAIHLLPQEMSIWSAVTKYIIPTTVEQMLDQLGKMLASRFYLREGLVHGLFQKIWRDNALVGLFDGSKLVNLYGLALQLRLFAKRFARPIQTDLTPLFDFTQPLPPFDAARLALSSHKGNTLFNTLPQLQENIAKLPETAVHRALLTLTHHLTEQLHTHHQQWANSRISNSNKIEAHLYDEAAKYCRFHVATTCLQVWYHNRERLSATLTHGAWLVLGLGRLLGLDMLSSPMVEFIPHYEQLETYLLDCTQKNIAYSLQPWTLAGRDSA